MDTYVCDNCGKTVNNLMLINRVIDNNKILSKLCYDCSFSLKYCKDCNLLHDISVFSKNAIGMYKESCEFQKSLFPKKDELKNNVLILNNKNIDLQNQLNLANNKNIDLQTQINLTNNKILDFQNQINSLNIPDIASRVSILEKKVK